MPNPERAQKARLIWIINLCLGFLGWIFSIVAVASCNFVSLVDVKFGIMKTNFAGCDNVDSCYVSTACGPYAADTIDAPHGVSKAFGIMATIFSSAILVLLFVGLFVKVRVALHRTIAGLFVTCVVCQLLTLTFVKTMKDVFVGYSFALGGGAVMAILAAIIFIVCATLMFVYPPPPEKIAKCCGGSEQQAEGQGKPPIGVFPPPPPGPQQFGVYPQPPPPGPQPVDKPQETGDYLETTYQVANPDGTITIVRETTAPDGTKTVDTQVVDANGNPVPGGGAHYTQPAPEPSQPMGQYEETTYEYPNPDGTATIITEVTAPDGSKTVSKKVVDAEGNVIPEAAGDEEEPFVDEGMGNMPGPGEVPPTEAEIPVEPVAPVPIVEATTSPSKYSGPGNMEQ